VEARPLFQGVDRAAPSHQGSGAGSPCDLGEVLAIRNSPRGAGAASEGLCSDVAPRERDLIQRLRRLVVPDSNCRETASGLAFYCSRGHPAPDRWESGEWRPRRIGCAGVVFLVLILDQQAPSSAAHTAAGRAHRPCINMSTGSDCGVASRARDRIVSNRTLPADRSSYGFRAKI